MQIDPAATDVVITGIGVVSPFGGAHDLAGKVAAGATAVRRLDGFPNASGAPIRDIPLDHLPADNRTRIGRLDRLCRLFLAAAFEAVQSADLDIARQADRVGLSFGTGLGCLLSNAEYFEKVVAQGPAAASPRVFAYTVSNAAAGEVSIALGIHGANITSHAGLAAGLQAIGYGADLIRLGKADVVLAGGADALGEALLRGLSDLGVLRDASPPFRGNRPGFCPSEGAAVFILERADLVHQRGQPPLARLAGYAAGFEPTLTQPMRQTEGLIATLRRALEHSRCNAADIGAVFTSAHGGALDEIERQALAAVFEAPTMLLTPKANLGEAFGASGLLAMSLALDWLGNMPAFTAGVASDLHGDGLAAAIATTRWQQARRVMIHSLCYAGPSVALVLARV